MYVTWVTGIPSVQVGRVEYAEPLLKSQEIITKPSLAKYFREWLGDGFVLSTNQKWKARRHSLTSAFNFAVLKDFIDIFEKHVQRLVQKLAILSENRDFVEVQKISKLSTLRNFFPYMVRRQL